MSTEKGEGISSQEAASTRPTRATHPPSKDPTAILSSTSSQPVIKNPPQSSFPPQTPQRQQPAAGPKDDGKKPAANKRDQPSESTSPSTPELAPGPRQVIAVSASKGPTAFFNLARKFLVTDEMCDLSALEGAIVAAVDAAHLLERSKLATIVR
jgi:hypothetical protein